MLKRTIIARLQKPSVILSLVSQATAVLLLIGFTIDEHLILSIATLLCSALVTLGILSNPDTENKKFGDDVMLCSKEDKYSNHIKINGQMLCAECGCAHSTN